MMELEEHNILKIYIDVTTHHHTNGFAFKDELAEVGTEKLMPALSLLFDEMNFSTKNIIIEKLEIDAGILPAKCWKEALMKAVLNEMKKTLEQHAQTQNFQNQQQGGKQEFTPTQALLYFLETGLLSWYTTSSDPNEILGNLLLHEPQKILQVLRKTIQENPVALNRLVNQFQEKILQQLITKAGINERTSNNLRKRWNTLFSQLSMREQEKKEKIYSSIIKSVLIQAEQTNEALQLSIVIKNIENLSKEHRKKLIQLLINIPERKEQKGLYEIKKICYENAGEIGFSAEEKAMLGLIETGEMKNQDIELGGMNRDSEETNERNKSETKDKKPSQQVPHREGHYIVNSGLVILNPFIVPLFANVGYIENKYWLNEETQQRAIALMQYMINGAETYPEYDLLLNKILCGYDLEKTLPVDLQLSDFEKQEVDDVLHSIIKHWTVLKNTSLDSLRNTFLQREGKLTFLDDEWLLQVEQKTVDILMNKMPWGVSYIKLPWMKHVLRTEWN